MHSLVWKLPPYILALVGFIWACTVILVIAIGTYQLFTHFLRPTPKPWSSRLPLNQIPHVTIIRPVDGREPYLRECLASTFQQNYPAGRLTVHFCIASKTDPAYILLERLVGEHPAFDARIFVEEEDTNLHGPRGSLSNLGPNPKIRNMSAAYRSAKGEVIWIVDCNVWVSSSTCGLMIDRLCGLSDPERPTRRKSKFVHQLPLAVEVSASAPLFPGAQKGGWGGALDELFLATAHAKFYTAISTVAIAPCSVGKSNMFRRYHLDALAPSQQAGRAAGIDFFSDNICEDHLIGDLLWKRDVPPEVQNRAALEGHPATSVMRPTANADHLSLHSAHVAWSNHSLILNPPCIQPLAHTSLTSYIARRARWLRVRKFTVPAATAVEPGTESFVAIACFATGATAIPWVRHFVGLAEGSWKTWSWVFACALAAWLALDLATWLLLLGWDGEGDQSGWESVRSHANTRAKPLAGKARARKGLLWWLAAWTGRELLAGPVWIWAVLGGTSVQWRGRTFRVGMDARVREITREMQPGKKQI